MAPDSPHAVDREARLDEVLVEYLEAVEAGTAPDRAELFRRHPDLAGELTAFFADQDEFDSLVAPLRTPLGQTSPAPAPTPSATRAPAAPPTGGYVGDYEVLEEIARGGMGVVYKARQLSLNRTVALKMILKGELASPEDVQRFRLEAEAAGDLDHPNIVPIYEVGEHEGQQYFSMKLIQGGNLGQQMSRLVGRPREAARLMVSVARAVEYAHRRGILHRDLKPANILLNEAGQPHVTDFGLAKRVAGPTASKAEDGRHSTPPDGVGPPRALSLTHSGAAVGTPSYMAPEQASGRKQASTTAADVYSLGAILYELLTGGPPFKADTPLNTLLEVLHREPLPPRTLRPGVDRDLETVCLKCLQKDPHQRYASAAGLADDLERYLQGEPILARPVGQLERLTRWCRRNRAVALLAALAAAALAGLVVLSSWFAVAESRSAANLRAALTKAERHAQEAQDRTTEAEQERTRADESFRQAHQAVNDCLRASEELSQLPGTQPVRKQLLDAALRYYEKFLEQRRDDPGLRAELAEAYYRVATITQTIGSRTDARAAYRHALTLYQDLAREQPQEPRWQHALVNTLNGLAITQDSDGQIDDALESARQALAICDRLVRDDPRAPSSLKDLAVVYEQRGHLRHQQGRLEPALADLATACDLREQLLCLAPDSLARQGDLALSTNNLGVVYLQAQRNAEALKCFEAARALREKMLAEAPRRHEFQIALAASYSDLGAAYEQLGRRDEALRFHEQAHTLREQVARNNPHVTLYQSDLAASLRDLGALHRTNRQPAAALKCYQESATILQQLLQVDPSAANRQADLARSYFDCGLVLGGNHQREDAVRAYGKARALQENLVRAHPEQAGYRSDLASTLNNLALILAQLGRLEEALPLARAAVENQRAAMTRATDPVPFRRTLATNYGMLAQVARAANRPEESVAALLERRQLCSDQPRELDRIAGELVLTARAVGTGKPPLSPSEQALRRCYLELARETLRQAVACGYRDFPRLWDDPNLAELRQRDDFQELVAPAPK
jgi:tetratricopeptide (TPR) repeat protein/tRNA A-37 threonylcarbamoyl transferase component Bud32